MRASSWPTWPKRSRSSRKTHEPAGRTQPGADPVPALVRDPRHAVLAVSAPATAAGAEVARCRGLVGGLARFRAGHVLGPCLGRSGLRTDVAADRGDRDRLRCVPGCAGGRSLVAPGLAAKMS